ncbi:hypothetical protein [Pseudoalteromonas rubra]|uniref:Uncharacterized protein n=1 Tax=Pseudoalteromonas rubra TaxID=43658 RepID=A0A0U3IAJ3_9GAMM|nr:hypothetical protein [Pseudoalteromonas rubra]ALU45103.1 hypothetical protein AT705_14210 [Pseudoalteromonas rubra]
MTSNEKLKVLKALLDSLSFRDLTLTLDLLVTGAVVYFYATSLMAASAEQLASGTWISQLLIKVVGVSVVLSIISQLLLELVSDGDVEKPLDEREKYLSLVGNKYALWILQAGVCFAIGQYALEQNGLGAAQRAELPFLTLHIMVGAFLLAELVNYVTQLIQNRMGTLHG